MPNPLYLLTGNWHLAYLDAVYGIAVFTNNHTMFNQYLNIWRQRTESYLYYLPDDGASPVTPPSIQYTPYNTKDKLWCFWLSRSSGCSYSASYQPANGQCQETCRDFGHVGIGLSCLFNTAETLYIQGIDVWTEYKDRFWQGLEYNAQWINAVWRHGDPYPPGFCDNNVPPNSTQPTYEIAYNALHNRLGLTMPNLTATLALTRPKAYPCVLNMCWETMTSAETGL
jgi:hypothetical protein